MGNEIVSSLSEGVSWYADYDVRGVGLKADLPKDKDGRGGGMLRLLDVPTPAWMPDSFLRSMKRNLYFNMINNAAYWGTKMEGANGGASLDFYKDDTSNPLEKLAQSAVKSIVSVAQNQVMSVASKVESLASGAASLFGSDSGGGDMLQKMNDEALNPFLASQPYIEIYGIHVAEKIGDVYETIEKVCVTMGANFNKLFTGSSGQGFTDKFKSFMDESNKNLTNALKALGVVGNDVSDIGTALNDSLTNDDRRMHNLAESQLLNSIGGYYTLRCRMPYFDSHSPLLASSGTRAFETGWGAGGGKNALRDFLQDNVSAVVWNRAMNWNPKKLDDGIQPVNYSFHIYNDTLEHVMLNLGFIWLFGATTQAVTDLVTIRPPYLYDVEVPGGFLYKYCTCDFSVQPGGRVRRLMSPMMSVGGEASDSNMMATMFKTVFKYDVNCDAITYVPDYYKVSVRFRSLLPNLWNFIHSFLHDKSTRPATGDKLMRLLAKAVNSYAGGGR